MRLHQRVSTGSAVLVLPVLLAQAAMADDTSFQSYLSAIRHDYDAAAYQSASKDERKAAFEALLEEATEFGSRFPDKAEAVAWEGIVLSTYAGEVGAMSAMKYAKAARKALLEAARLDAAALGGGIYASLGALYSKVPGGIIGFGDDEVAEEYFAKALAVDPQDLDANYFYAEHLLDQGRYAEAVRVIERALELPPVKERPSFDASRREALRAMLGQAEQRA